MKGYQVSKIGIEKENNRHWLLIYFIDDDSQLVYSRSDWMYRFRCVSSLLRDFLRLILRSDSVAFDFSRCLPFYSSSQLLTMEVGGEINSSEDLGNIGEGKTILLREEKQTPWMAGYTLYRVHVYLRDVLLVQLRRFLLHLFQSYPIYRDTAISHGRVNFDIPICPALLPIAS